MWKRGSAGAPQTTRRSRTRYGADPLTSRSGPRPAGLGQALGELLRSRASITPRVAQLSGWPNGSPSPSPRASAQVSVLPNDSAVAGSVDWLCRARCRNSWRTADVMAHRLLVPRKTSFASHCQGQDPHQSTLTPSYQQGCVEAKLGLWRRRTGARAHLLEEIGKTVTSDRDASACCCRRDRRLAPEWLAKWGMPKLTSNDAPLNPLSESLGSQHTVDIKKHPITQPCLPALPTRQAFAVLEAGRAVILYQAGRDHTARLGYWACDGRQARKTRQAMHQRRGMRDRLYGMDFRNRGARESGLQIMSILLNNLPWRSSKLKVMPILTEKYRFARHFWRGKEGRLPAPLAAGIAYRS